MTNQMKRIEHDAIGSMAVDTEAYYGIQSLRALENFPITGLKMHPELIKIAAQVKKAAAISNYKIGRLDEKRMKVMVAACEEIAVGKLHDQFIVDPIQGGAGTSFHTNVNEVIANRAIELLGEKKGDYTHVHPNDHVNFSQSTNDVFSSCGKITTYKLLEKCKKQLELLSKALNEKAGEFDGVIKMGRTQMQDAVPIRLGQEFHAYNMAICRDIRRFERAKEEVRSLNLGGTAIGTGVNTDPAYTATIIKELQTVTGLPLELAEDLIDATQNLDSYVMVSCIIKSCAVNLSKISNDLRLMSSGPRTGFNEINLPARQNGSTIMPGKVNPVIPEVMNQTAFHIIGNDVTITMASEAGQLELNAFEPVVFFNLFQSLDMLTASIKTFTNNCIKGITANEEHCRGLVENSVGIITVLCPYLGYEKASIIAKKAIQTGTSVKALILDENLLSEAQIDAIMDPRSMTKPGIPKIEIPFINE